MSGTDSPASSMVEPRPAAVPPEEPAAPSAGAASAPTVSPSAVETLGLPPCVEAALFASERALSAARLAQALLGPEHLADTADDDRKRPTPPEAVRRIEAAIKDLNTEYERSGRSFRIEAVPGGYRVMTLARFAPALSRLSALKPPTRLSRAAIETLSIIAYRQPIGRAQLEAIRGVACGEVLKSLIERRLVTITGRAEELGRPMLYGTTRQFLDAFGLASLTDLPQEGELAGARQDV